MSENLYVVTNAAGDIVSVGPSFSHGQTKGGIMPLEGQTLHFLESVESSILGKADPNEFHQALTRYFGTARNKQTIRDTDAHILELLKRAR